MMRVCHLNTCPVGVATQDPRAAREVRGQARARGELHALHRRGTARDHGAARLPHRRGNGRPRGPARADAAPSTTGRRRASTSRTCSTQPEVDPDWGRYCQDEQDHGLEKSLDVTVLLDLCKPAIERGEEVVADLPIRNVNRVVGTITGSEITRKYGAKGLPEDTIRLHFRGSAGQSFGAFIPPGHDALARRRRQRLRRQGPLGRQDRRLPAARGHVRRRGQHHRRQRRALRRDRAARPSSAAWRASASASATAACTRSSRRSATTAANT